MLLLMERYRNGGLLLDGWLRHVGPIRRGMNKSKCGVLTAGQLRDGAPIGVAVRTAGRARGHTAAVTVTGALILGPLSVALSGPSRGHHCGETEAWRGSTLKPQTQDPNPGLLRV